MNNVVYDKTYIAEITIPQSSTASQFLFPVLQNLDRKLTTGIQTYSVSLLTKTPAQAIPANNALLAVSYLNLIVGDVNQIWNLPLIDLLTNVNPTGAVVYNPFSVEFNNLPIIWAKSFVTVADISKISGAQAEAFIFNIKYSDIPVASNR
jgi:hypothetical protein